MEVIEALLDEGFKVGFGADYEIATRVACVIECALSIVTVGAGGASNTT